MNSGYDTSVIKLLRLYTSNLFTKQCLLTQTILVPFRHFRFHSVFKELSV